MLYMKVYMKLNIKKQKKEINKLTELLNKFIKQKNNMFENGELKDGYYDDDVLKVWNDIDNIKGYIDDEIETLKYYYKTFMFQNLQTEIKKAKKLNLEFYIYVLLEWNTQKLKITEDNLNKHIPILNELILQNHSDKTYEKYNKFLVADNISKRSRYFRNILNLEEKVNKIRSS